MATTNMAMVKVYANLVVNGRRTIESLPIDYQQPVQDYIDANGLANSVVAETV